MVKKQVDFDNFAEDYRAIHTQNVQGISGVDSNYFGEQKVKIVWEELNSRGGREKIRNDGKINVSGY